VVSGGEKVGMIKKEQAGKVAEILDKFKDAFARKSFEVSAKMTSAGDGFTQSLQMEIFRK
jgi:hypothetical protein